MSRTNKTSKQKRRGKTLPALGADFFLSAKGRVRNLLLTPAKEWDEY